MEENDNNAKINRHFFTKKRIIINLVAISIVIAIALTVAYLIPKTPVIKGGDIKIGDVTIKEKQITDYAGSLEEYKRQNPEIVFGSDFEKVASDDLIMNAALRYYSKKYNVVITNKDILDAALINTADEDEADRIIFVKLGDPNGFRRIRNENVAYQKKLAGKILAIKSLFIVRITFDTPYFNSLADDKVQSAYDSAQAKLKKDFLPLFVSKMSKEDISKKADVNFIDDDFTDDQDGEQYFNGPIVGASVEYGYRADGSYFNNVDDISSYVRGNVGKVYNIDDKIATLKNVGDYTDVFASKVGAFTIIRLEEKTNGQFNSWKDMLESFKRQYAYNGVSTVYSDVSYGTQKFIESVASGMAKLGADKAYAADGCGDGKIIDGGVCVSCGVHGLVYHFKSFEAGVQAEISGLTTVKFKASGRCMPDNDAATSFTAYDGGHAQTKDVSITTSGVVSWNCYNAAPNISDENGAQLYPSNDADYTFNKIRSPFLYNSSDDTASATFGHTTVDQHNGLPSWAGDLSNSLKNIYVNFLYTKDNDEWSVSPSVTVSPAVVHPGDTITWSHSVTVADGSDPTDKNVSYIAYGGPSSTVDDSGTIFGGTNTLASGALANSSATTTLTYDIPDNDSQVGKRYCRRTKAKPYTWTDEDSETYSGQTCITVSSDWTLSVDTKIQKNAEAFGDSDIIALPNDIIRWKHIITNTGHKTDADFSWKYHNDATLFAKTGNTYGASHTVAAGLLQNGTNETAPINLQISNLSGLTEFKISQDDVGVDAAGDGYCRSTYVSKQAWNNLAANDNIDPLCVTVPYNYELTPYINNLDPSVGAIVGQNVTIYPKVNNSGPTKSKMTDWNVKISKNGVDYTYAPTISGSQVFDASTVSFPNETSLGAKNYTISSDFQPGDDICFTLYIQPYKSSSSDGKQSSPPVCLTIGKQPKIQVWSGDVWSNGPIKTSTPTIAGKLYGSWAEYGILSKSSINGMASKSFFNNSIGIPTDCNYSILSFTNKKCSVVDGVGHYDIDREVPDIANNFPTISATNLSGVVDVGTLNGTYKADTNISISGTVGYDAATGIGNTVVINSTGDVTITNDIKYPTLSYTKSNQVPQLIIIAKNINIEEAATNIDAWLVAKDGVINTCSNYNISDIRLSHCKDKLTINGPVIAKQILLHRTAGSEIPDYNAPGEIFNLRADVYLWSAAKSTSTTTIRTVYTVEQPARF